MSDKLDKLRNTVKSIKSTLQTYKKTFLENDGTIDTAEQKQLDALELQLKDVEEKILVLEKESDNLDELYELVIEFSKKASSKPTIENKKAYLEVLENFDNQFKKSNRYLQKLWKNAQEDSAKESTAVKEKLVKGEAVKDKIARLEQTEAAKIYFIVKGKNPDGTEWGRIDFVGVNYTDAYKDLVSQGAVNNKLPLVIEYFTYVDGNYIRQKKSHTLETAFDKQLMDIFQKSGNISYEQHKNLGRDYEYSPTNAALTGKGPWYVNIGKMAATNSVEKVIEVPDWDDFNFKNLYQEYLDKCNKGILLQGEQKVLKAKMTSSIEKQKARTEELVEFHQNQNDEDKNTAILINIWKKKIQNYETDQATLKENCFSVKTFAPPCTDFETVLKKHEDLCARNALPKRVGDDLKQQLQDCLTDAETLLNDKKAAIHKYKSIPNWQNDAAVKTEVEKLEKEVAVEQTKMETQKAQLEGLPEECLRPIALEILFEGNSNKIIKMDDAQLAYIAIFLRDNPEVQIELIANTSGDPLIPIENVADKEVNHSVITEHTLSTPPTKKDLMMIRGYRIKMLFEQMGIASNRLHVKAGKALGGGEENRKVTLNYL